MKLREKENVVKAFASFHYFFTVIGINHILVIYHPPTTFSWAPPLCFRERLLFPFFPFFVFFALLFFPLLFFVLEERVLRAGLASPTERKKLLRVRAIIFGEYVIVVIYCTNTYYYQLEERSRPIDSSGIFSSEVREEAFVSNEPC